MTGKQFQSAVGGLGARVREAREAAGQTTRSLAELAGMSAPGVTRIEMGDSGASLAAVERLAWALEVRAGWLAFGEEPRAR